MTSQAVVSAFPPMRMETLDAVMRVEDFVASFPQTDITTQHTLHAGMYARTMKLPAGQYLVGALVQVETIVIFDGDADVFTGDSTIRLAGHHVIAASAFRKQIYKSHADCHITAIHATDAKTIAEAEAQATQEHNRLASRRQGSTNIETGEYACLTQQQSQQ